MDFRPMIEFFDVLEFNTFVCHRLENSSPQTTVHGNFIQPGATKYLEFRAVVPARSSRFRFAEREDESDYVDLTSGANVEVSFSFSASTIHGVTRLIRSF